MYALRIARWALSAMVIVGSAVVVGCSSTRGAGAVDSPGTLTRKAAVAELGARADMSSYDTIVYILKNDSDRLVRSQAAFALGDLNRRYYSVAFQPLVEALETDPSVFVRAASALALSETPDSRAIEPLVAALYDTAHGEVKVWAGNKVITYRACPADAARTALEKIAPLKFRSIAVSADTKRKEIASQWQRWYGDVHDLLPEHTAVAEPY